MVGREAYGGEWELFREELPVDGLTAGAVVVLDITALDCEPRHDLEDSGALEIRRKPYEYT